MKPMPSCPEVRERLTDYSDGVLPVWEALTLRWHLRACAACRTFHQGLETVPILAQRLLTHQPGPAPPEAVAALEAALRRIAAARGEPLN